MNAIQGFVPDRRFDVNAILGPVVTIRKNAKNNTWKDFYDPFNDYMPVTVTGIKDNQINVGGEFAIEASYNLNDQIGIFIKPQLRIYPSSILPSEFVPGWRKIISCQMGAAYKFKL